MKEESEYFLSSEKVAVVIRFVIPVVFVIKLDWSVCTCLTQLYDGREMYRIYYIKNKYIPTITIVTIFSIVLDQ